MSHDHCVIRINEEEITNFYDDFLKMEVELDDELAAMFRLRLCFQQLSDGRWTNIDEEIFRVWNTIVIEGGYKDNKEELIRGFITKIKPQFDPDPTRAAFDIWGMDESVLLDRVEVLQDWANKKDSDIATEIFADYGLMPDVDDTSVVHEEAFSTIIQRETDMQFLKRLALRNGFECYVEAGKGVFKSPDIDADPQPVLATHFGDETNLHRFEIDVDGLRPSDISMAQMDRTTKETIDVSIESSQQSALGETDSTQIPGLAADRSRLVVGRNGATGNAEMTALCQGLFHQAEWFVTAEGDVAGNDYNHILRPRKKVTIKGIGETYSGEYYVQHVTHVFTGQGYMQQIKVKRNGLLPTGNEDFAGDATFAGGLL